MVYFSRILKAVKLLTLFAITQALLEKHEKSMAAAEREKMELTQKIEYLQDRSRELEMDNERRAEENRRLLNDLEDMGGNMSSSEARVRELQEDLELAQVELARKSAQAARAERLEAQLAMLEEEQESLRNLITTTKEEERAADARWRKSERTLLELTEQLDRIEREHRMEKARAQNLIERLEKRRLMERDDGAFPSVLADRTAVSQYMKEILAENTSLQSGMAEMRELLIASQEEVATLREQLMEATNVNPRTSLSRQLSGIARPRELHFHHHHYHTKAAPVRTAVRRHPKKKRVGSEQFTPLSKIIEPSSASPPVSPISSNNRWSVQSGLTSATMSSFPGSPLSTNYRDSSIFDKPLNPPSTRPSTAESMEERSPVYPSAQKSDSIIPPFPILTTSDEVAEILSRPPSRLYRSTSHESLLSIIDSAPSSSATLMSTSPHRSPFNLRSPDSQVAPQQVVASGRGTPVPSHGKGSLAYNQLLLSSAAARAPAGVATSQNAVKRLPKWLWKWAPAPLANLASTGTATSATDAKSDGSNCELKPKSSASSVVSIGSTPSSSTLVLPISTASLSKSVVAETVVTVTPMDMSPKP